MMVCGECFFLGGGSIVFNSPLVFVLFALGVSEGGGIAFSSRLVFVLFAPPPPPPPLTPPAVYFQFTVYFWLFALLKTKTYKAS